MWIWITKTQYHKRQEPSEVSAETFAFLIGLYKLPYNLQCQICTAIAFQTGNYESKLKQGGLEKQSYGKQNSDTYNRTVDCNYAFLKAGT